MSTLDHASNPAELPSGTLTELFVTAVEKHGSRLAYRYFPDEGSALAGVTFDEALAASKPFRAGGLQPRLNARDGSVRDF